MAKTPKIRFKNFTDEWVKNKLGEICQITMGQSPDGATYSEIPSDYILVQGNADLKNGFVYPRIYTTQKTKMAYTGDLIMSVRAPAGAMGKTLYNVVLGRGVAGIKGNEFIYQNLIKFDMEGYWSSFSAGSTFESLNSNVIFNAIISIPNSKEQEKIGAFFSKLDKLISLHQSKFEKLQKIKKSCLQNLFPQNSQNTPKIRFAGFTDPWEQRKFEDIGSVSMCKRIFKEETTDNGDIPFYKIGTFGSAPDAFISKDLFEEYKNKYSYPKKGDILLSASGTIGRIVEYNGEEAYFQDSNIVWLSHDNSICNSFLKTLYPIVKWNGIEGSTIQRLYNDNFLKTEFMMPSLAEQEKIGAFFSKLDKLITLHQSKFEKLQKIKKSCLQNMFV